MNESLQGTLAVETLTTDELTYRLSQQSLLAEFASFALQSRDLDAVLQRATELCAAGLRTPYAKILCYRPEQNDLLMVAGVGWEEGSVGNAALGADLASPAGFAYHTRQSVLSNHLEHEERFRTPELLRRHNIRRAINVLIEYGDGPERFGVMEVDSPDAGMFDTSDAHFLAGFAALLGIAIERQHKDRLLAQALEHQSLLTREMSHRVKNSLAVVSSLLRIQARGGVSDEVRKALDDAGSRVATVAQVHDHLWRGEMVGEVDLVGFLRDLCRNLEGAGPGHPISCEGPSPLQMSADRAIPLGLFVNETITNAMKYAYPEGQHGQISVKVEADDERVTVSVSDQGNGFPPDFDFEAARESLGLKIVNSFARQLEAELKIEPRANPGCRFTVSFARSASVAH